MNVIHQNLVRPTAGESINAIESGRMVPSTILALKLALTLELTVEELFSIEPAGAGAAD